MSIRGMIAVTVMSVSALFAAPGAWAQDATVDQVYQAAHAGKYAEAQAMMDQVLRAHPNSGKAHYVEAELLAGQGKMSAAASELAKAEKLAPGLPFAKPGAVQQLRAQIAGGAKPVGRLDTGVGVPAVAPAAARPGIPWGWIIGLGALAALIVFALRRNRANKYAQQRYAPAAGPVGGGVAGAPQYGPMGPGGVPGAGGGIGAGLAGGLATGAGLGAGLVAGQALMHQFTDRDRAVNDAAGNNPAPGAAPPSQTPDPLLGAGDMGGEDFGISDPGNWDDGSGGLGSGDEWT